MVRKIISYFSLLLLFFTGVATASIPDDNASDQAFDIALDEYQSIIEEALVWRAEAVSFIQALEGGSVYTSDQLTTIHEKGTNHYRAIREQLLAVAERYEWITESGTTFKLTSGESRIVNQGRWWNPFDDGNKLIEVNPEDQIGQLHIKKAKLSLASALILYDNYLVAIEQYRKVEKLRRLINSDNSEVDDYLDKVSESFMDLDHYERTARAIQLIDEEFAWEFRNATTALAKDDQNIYLNQLIQDSLTYRKIDEISLFDIHKARIRFFAENIRDTIVGLTDAAGNEVSKLFGNGVGLIATRRGKLDSLSEVEQQQISATLKPLDILLEKTPFRLTDKFIPGHWGHVAVWVGSEEELKALGIWDRLPELYRHAVIAYGYDGPDFQQEIREGKRIIEALRPGVEINPLKSFLNIDDLAVVRHHSLNDMQKRDYLIRAFEQIGKEYDFNFDVETDKKIVCSELAYVVYKDAQFGWPTDKTLGRYTISPDNIASKAVANSPFYPVLLYYDGKRVDKNIDENFAHLLYQEYDKLSL